MSTDTPGHVKAADHAGAAPFGAALAMVPARHSRDRALGVIAKACSRPPLRGYPAGKGWEGRKQLGLRFGVILASSWRHLGVIMASFGLSWPILASSWRHFGLSWLILASSWCHLGSFWRRLGSSWRILANLGSPGPILAKSQRELEGVPQFFHARPRRTADVLVFGQLPGGEPA